MSVLGMVKARERRERWQELYDNPDKRQEIRDACRQVLEAQSATAEFWAIQRLAQRLP